MALDTIDRRRVAWALVISGLPHRYVSGPCPGDGLSAGRLYYYSGPGGTPPLVVLQEPVDVVAVLSVGSIEMHLDDLGCVAEQEPVEVRLLARDARTADGERVHPYQTLGRLCGPASADRAVRLVAGLEHATIGSGPVDIEVSRSCSAWTLPGPVHIGQEVIWADSADTAGGRYYLRDCIRGVDGWATQEHPVSVREHEEPWVTIDVTAWRGRAAMVYVAPLSDTGEPLGWSEYWAGVLDSAPETNGDEIVVRIAPLTAVLGYTLGVGSAARTAQSVSGWHRIVEGYCDRIVWREARRAYVSLIPVDADGGDPSYVEFDPRDYNAVPLLAESLAGFEWLADTVPPYWQAHASLDDANHRIYFDFNGGDNLPAAVDAEFIDGYPPVGVAVLQRVVGSVSLLPANGDEVVEWPARLVDIWNVSHIQVPMWPSYVYDAELRMLKARLVPGDGVIQATVPFVDYGDVHLLAWHAGFQLDSDDPRSCWAGIVGDPSLTIDAGEGPPREGRRPLRAGAGVGWRQIGEVVSATDSPGDQPQRLDLGGVPVWWLGRDEIWCGPWDADIYTGAGTTQTIHVSGEGVDADIYVTGSETIDGLTYYALDQRRRVPELRVLPGGAPLTAQVIATAIDTDPGTYLLRLLESGVGNGDNGPSDVLPIGSNIRFSRIDFAALSGLACPAALRGQDYTAVRGQSIKSQVEGLLMACGVQVVQAYGDGPTWRISLVHLGPASTLGSSLSLTDADLLDDRDGLVQTVADGRTVRAYVVRLNHDLKNGPDEVSVACATERNDAGADSGKPLDLDLPGVVVDRGAGTLAQAAVDIVADMRARVGVPRVRWALGIRADLAPGIGLGDTVTVTSSYAVPVRPTETVSGVPCRIVGLVRDLEANVVRLELRPYPARGAGWAPAMRVASVTSAKIVEVEADYYSSDDPGMFAALDKVDCVPVGDWSSRVSTSLVSVTGTTVETLADHGLAAGDTIRLDSYSVAVAQRSALGGYAWLSDGDEELPGGVAGQVIG